MRFTIQLVYPLEAKKWEQSSKSLLRGSVLEDRRVVAIGELGLDFLKNENKAVQIDALIPQMELAFELDLPVIIHCRDAANELIEICNDLSKNKNALEEYYIVGQELQKKWTILGPWFLYRFSGIVTFPKLMKFINVPKSAK